jgi:hypothetical protein
MARPSAIIKKTGRPNGLAVDADGVIWAAESKRPSLVQESGSARTEILKRMRAIAAQEIELAQRQFLLARRNSTIGFEASNHYYFTPLDLVEKVLNCRDIIALMA